MATWTKSYASWVTMRVVATETSVDVPNNRSQVKVEVWLDSSSTTRVWNHDPQSVTATIDGTAMPANSYTYELYNRGSVRILNVSRWVPHNSDGTKTARIQVSASGGGQGASIDQNLTLTTIPRASSISSISGGTLGSLVTVNISRASGSFTHKVIYRRTDGVNVTIASSAGTSATFTPALSDSALIPNATSGTATMIVETYSGSTKVGTASRTFTVTVPSNVVPTVSTRTYEEAVTAIKNRFGFYVQNQSKIKFTIGGTGAQGSSVRSYRTVINGQTFTGTSGTTDILRTSGTNTISMEVTDSRGRKGTWSTTFSVAAYSPPVIELLTVVRAQEDGTEDPDEGAWGKMAYRVRYTSYQQSPSIDINPLTLKWRHKRTDQSAWDESTTVYHNNSPLSGAVLIPGMDVDYAYDYELVAEDFFTSVSRRDTLATAFTTIDFLAGGKGVSFGGVANGPGATFKLPAAFEGGITFDRLPEGDGTMLYWYRLKNMFYFCGPNTTPDQPGSYGFVFIMRHGSEFNAIWFTQPQGKIYRKSGNAANVTGWIELH